MLLNVIDTELKNMCEYSRAFSKYGYNHWKYVELSINESKRITTKKPP